MKTTIEDNVITNELDDDDFCNYCNLPLKPDNTSIMEFHNKIGTQQMLFCIPCQVQIGRAINKTIAKANHIDLCKVCCIEIKQCICKQNGIKKLGKKIKNDLK